MKFLNVLFGSFFREKWEEEFSFLSKFFLPIFGMKRKESRVKLLEYPKCPLIVWKEILMTFKSSYVISHH